MHLTDAERLRLTEWLARTQRELVADTDGLTDEALLDAWRIMTVTAEEMDEEVHPYLEQAERFSKIGLAYLILARDRLDSFKLEA